MEGPTALLDPVDSAEATVVAGEEELIATLAGIVADDGIAFVGRDKADNLMFRMPQGNSLLSQRDAARWGRRILNQVKAKAPYSVLCYVESARGFKFLAPR